MMRHDDDEAQWNKKYSDNLAIWTRCNKRCSIMIDEVHFYLQQDSISAQLFDYVFCKQI